MDNIRTSHAVAGYTMLAIVCCVLSIVLRMLARMLWEQNRQQWRNLASWVGGWPFIGRVVKRGAMYFESERSFCYNYRLGYVMMAILAVVFAILAVLESAGIRILGG